MAIIRSFGALQKVAAPTPTWETTQHVGDYSWLAGSYAQIYRAQPILRAVIDFLSWCIADCELHAYRRLADDDRVRIAEHDVIRWLRQPAPKLTRFELFEYMMRDLCIYGNAFWLKVRMSDRIGLYPLLPADVTIAGAAFPIGYTWEPQSGVRQALSPNDVVHFRYYDPESRIKGLSPIETLRGLLAEEVAASQFRSHSMRNGARIEGVIERPREAGKWTKEQRDTFKNDWAAFQGSKNAGRTPVLEDGMTWKPTSFSAQQSELNASREKIYEAIARAYQVPLPMVGLLAHATFSNVKEQHKHLYQDAVGPKATWISEVVEGQLLPDSDDTEAVYLEFNLAKKLEGSFEEKTASLLKSTGGKPILTQNEARAKLNLPKSEEPGADSLEPPANIQGNRSDVDHAERDITDPVAAMAAVRASFHRQEARLSKLPEAERAVFFAKTLGRWDAELASDLRATYGDEATRIASVINGETLALLNAGTSAFDREVVWPC